MAETHSEEWHPTGGPVDGRGGHAGVLWSAGTGTDEYGVGLQYLHIGQCHGIVAMDHWVGTELPQILDEVVDERVIVIDDEDADAHWENANRTTLVPHQVRTIAGARILQIMPTSENDQPTGDQSVPSRPRPIKKRVQGGRVTPKGTRTGAPVDNSMSAGHDPSPTWMTVLLFGLLGLGVVIIFFNYVGWMPGGTSNGFLLLGLGSILGGIITATQYH